MKTQGSIRTTAFLLVVCLIAAAALPGIGCAGARPYAHERVTVTDTNGVTTTTDRTMKTTTWNLWPSKSEIERQTVSAGKAWKIGQEGIDVESTGGTNGVQALREIRGIMQALPK